MTRNDTSARRPMMLSLLRESLRSARFSMIPTLTIIVLAACMSLLTLTTASRSAQARDEVLERLDQAGAREVIIADVSGVSLLNESMVAVMENMSSTQVAVGLSLPYDAVNTATGPGGSPVPAWIVTGELSRTIELIDGREPEPGEALISSRTRAAFGLELPFGSLTDRSALERLGSGSSVPIVGTFRAREPFADLENGAVIRAGSSSPVQSLRIVFVSAQVVKQALPQVLGVVSGTKSTAGLTVQSPSSLADLQVSIASDLGSSSQFLILAVNAAASLLIVIVVLSDVLLRRRDLGRRRALGAPRWVVITIVVLRSTLPAAAGSAAGSVLAITAFVDLASGVDLWVVLATICLTLVVSTLAAVGPATYGAFRDPVRILRTA